MKENARQGFWNGATAPLGYKLVEAEKRGTKIKRKLDLDPVEAETVRLIFKLYLHGDGNSGALGVKEVVKWLNRRGYRTQRGETFGVASVHKILTNTVYIGQWKFNKTSSRTRQRKPDEEVITRMWRSSTSTVSISDCKYAFRNGTDPTVNFSRMLRPNPSMRPESIPI